MFERSLATAMALSLAFAGIRPLHLSNVSVTYKCVRCSIRDCWAEEKGASR